MAKEITEVDDSSNKEMNKNLLELVEPTTAKPVLTATIGRHKYGGPKYG
jgi:hypothetical protein